MTGIAPKEQHPATQLLIFIGITACLIGAGYIFGAGIVVALYGVKALTEIAQLSLADPNAANALWILQIVSTTIPIFAASFVYAKYIIKNTDDYLRLSFKFPWFLIAVIFCVMLVSAPVIEALANINQQLILPGLTSNSGIVQRIVRWIVQTEKNAEGLTALLLQMKSVPSMLLKLTLVGLITAIVEEFMFRGCIQTMLLKWTKNPHAAVWITAALFSFFHLEFLGFLPRLLLGVLFGYFVVWSGSIWPAVWAHFINNGTAVVASYLYQNQMLEINPDDTHIFNWKTYLFSLIIMLFLLYLSYAIAIGKMKMRFK